MSGKRFGIQKHDHADKSFEIICHGQSIRLIVDYDDVDHDQVDEDAQKIVKVLNEHWKE